MTTIAGSDSLFRQIWEILDRRERRAAIALLGAMLVGMFLETLGIGLVIPALTLLTQQDFLSRHPAIQSQLTILADMDHQTIVMTGMVALVTVYLLKSLFLGCLVWKQSQFAYGVQARVSQQLFTNYLFQSYTFHLQRNSAELIRNVVTEMSQFTFGALLPGLLLLTELLVSIGLCFLLLIIEPVGAISVFILLIVVVWVFHSVSRARVTQWGEGRQFHEGQRIKHLQQGLGGVKDVKVLGREQEFLAQFGIHNSQNAHMGALHATLQQLPRLGLELLAAAGLAILVITMLSRGRDVNNLVPILGVFAAAAFRILPSVNRILNAMQSLRYGLPVIKVIHTEIQLATLTPSPRRYNQTYFKAVIHLNQVSYSYPGVEGLSLNNLSLLIRKGESIGIMGSSGAGKSTLVDILLGLLTPISGEVMVDGENIQANLRRWQNQIGYVPQFIFLSDDTIRRNVAFGLPNDMIDEAAMARAISASRLADFVNSLPDGLDTVVGERGVRLSGGQRQRIGIARALYHDPAVLILDEATSALDVATEREIVHAIKILQGLKTIVIVSHRLSTVEYCDSLYELQNGRLVSLQPAAQAIAYTESFNLKGNN